MASSHVQVPGSVNTSFDSYFLDLVQHTKVSKQSPPSNPKRETEKQSCHSGEVADSANSAGQNGRPLLSLKCTKQPAESRRKRGVAGGQGLQACARCRSHKRRCDGARPCMTCIQRGCASECVDWNKHRALAKKFDERAQDTSCELIERPFKWRQFGTNLVAHGQDSSCGPASLSSLANFGPEQIVQKFLNFPFFGTHAARFSAIFASMPASLVDAIASCVTCVPQQTEFFRRIANSPQALRSVSNHNSYPGVAYIGHWISPDGTDEVLINDAYCSMFGGHPEEVLARLEARELPSVFSDFDAVCLLLNCLDWSLCSFHNRTEVMQWYCVVGRGTDYTPADGDAPPPVLARVEVRVRYDEHGQPASVENWFIGLSESEFDLAVELNPHFCRPFARVCGDARQGAQLLQEYAQERAAGLGQQLQAPLWHTRVQRLEAVVRRRVARAQERFLTQGARPSFPYMSNAMLDDADTNALPQPEGHSAAGPAVTVVSEAGPGSHGDGGGAAAWEEDVAATRAEEGGGAQGSNAEEGRSRGGCVEGADKESEADGEGSGAGGGSADQGGGVEERRGQRGQGAGDPHGERGLGGSDCDATADPAAWDGSATLLSELWIATESGLLAMPMEARDEALFPGEGGELLCPSLTWLSPV